MNIIKYYLDAWFKVEYSIDKPVINFKVFKFKTIDKDNPEKSETDEEPTITGFIKWDGYCEFDYSEHYCGIHHAEQFLMLMKEIYAFNELNNN